MTCPVSSLGVFNLKRSTAEAFALWHVLHLYRVLQAVNSLFAMNTFSLNKKNSPVSHPAD